MSGGHWAQRKNLSAVSAGRGLGRRVVLTIAAAVPPMPSSPSASGAHRADVGVAPVEPDGVEIADIGIGGDAGRQHAKRLPLFLGLYIPEAIDCVLRPHRENMTECIADR
jgi:hypothetical protein